MSTKTLASLGLLLAASLFSRAQAPTWEAAVLSLRIIAPVQGHRVPLTQALSDVGIRLQGGYVVFGVELRLTDEAEPAVNLSLEPGSTLGHALNQIIRQAPGYTFEIVSEHLINVFPLGRREDPANILNLRIPRFDAVDAQPGDIIRRPKDFVPELKDRLEPKAVRPRRPSISTLKDVGPGITLHLQGVTLLQLLNAVSEATQRLPSAYAPIGWVYSFRPDPQSPVGGTHSWSVHSSVPSGWKHEAEKSRVPPG